MVINTKNVQLDTHKIQKTVSDSWKYCRDPKSILSDKVGSFPVAATIELIGLSFPIPKEYMRNYGMNGHVPYRTDLNSMDLEAGIKVPRVYCNIAAEISMYNTNSELKIEVCDLGRLYQTSAIGITRRSKVIVSAIDKIVAVAREIESFYFLDGWVLTLNSSYSLDQFMGDIGFYDTVYGALLRIQHNLSQSDIGAPIMTYEAIDDVLALNVIKIISKGTDTMENRFVGDCLGISFEALVSSRFYGKGSLTLMKTYAGRYQHLKSNNMMVIGDDVIYQLDECSNMKCTYLVERVLYDMAGINSLEASAEVSRARIAMATSDLDISDDEDASLRDILGSLTENNTGNLAESMAHSMIEYGRAMSELNSTKPVISDFGGMYSQLYHTKSALGMQKILIPRGIDLSNSFKAKYI